MKIDAWAFDPATFIQNKKLSGLLLYGSELGLKDYLITSLSKQASLTFLSEAAFLEESIRYLTPDLFMAADSKLFICIEDVSDKNAKAYQEILSSAPHAQLILYGPQLKSTSKLVQFALKQSFVQVVPCYSLEPRQMAPLIQRAGQHLHLAFSPEALKSLTHLLDPSILLNSLTKLSLYKGSIDNPPTPVLIELEDVTLCLGEAEEDSLEIAYAISGRYSNRVAQLLLKNGETLESIPLIRQVLRHFMMLLQVRSALDNQVSVQSAISQLSPPLFFKNVPLFQTHVQKWSLNQIYEALSLLEKAEVAVKQSSSADAVVPHFLCQIAQIEPF